MSLLPSGYQKRAFSCRVPEEYKRALRADFEKTGVARGIFFDTSGSARVECLNPDRQYLYFWRSDTNKGDGEGGR